MVPTMCVTALLANIILACKNLTGTNGLAYLAAASVTMKKTFCNIESRFVCTFFVAFMYLDQVSILLNFSVVYLSLWHKKLVCLSIAHFTNLTWLLRIVLFKIGVNNCQCWFPDCSICFNFNLINKKCHNSKVVVSIKIHISFSV